MIPTIDHYEGIDATPVVAVAMRGMSDLLNSGDIDQRIGMEGSDNGISATIDGKVVGVIVWVDQPELRRVHLQLGYIMPEYRGMGIYSHLWNALIERAQSLGRPEIWSSTAFNNMRLREVARLQGREEVAVKLRFRVPDRSALEQRLTLY